MCDQWMPHLVLPIPIEEFHRLPRNPAYKYEYVRGKAYVQPRPKFFHALLDLTRVEPAEAPDGILLKAAVETDFAELAPLFAGAFFQVQPFAGLEDAERDEAARTCLERTRSGGDGPWLGEASFVARDVETGKPIGAIFITLLPDGDPSDWESYYWKSPPEPGLFVKGKGRPHLTWVFVSPLEKGRGVGTALLAATATALQKRDYRELATTFLAGNDSSLLWHWRNGFQLLPYPGSRRQMEKRFTNRKR